MATKTEIMRATTSRLRPNGDVGKPRLGVLFRPPSHGRGHWLDPQLPDGSDSRWKTVPLHGAQNQTLMQSYPAKYGISTA
jgi:hypothetical protein